MGTSRWTTPLRRRAVALAAALGVLLSISLAAPATAAPTAHAEGRAMALSGSSFQPGYIIDDANFYQKSAMTQSQIQAFLASKVTCTNSNCLANLYAKTEARANDRNICLGYTPDSDAKELASTIIYKVQQSCGISARVLLVTLQKEQGLITNPAPTTGKLNAAMGWLCPDTAPCSNSAAGFFRQIYGSAWQFRRYNFPDNFGNFHIGTYSVRYSPSASCGSKTVKIRNNATAALYNYTPYTPNAGALSNLRGTAPCGSYGNRNFWVYYSDWFGSPLAGAGDGAIAQAYTAAGSETGALGARIGTGGCGLTATKCSRTYEHGVIYWSTSVGAVVVSGAIGDYYKAQGGTTGVLGTPNLNAVAMNGGANGNGVNQPFTGGLVSSSAAGIFALRGNFRTEHAALGGVAGSMGWPLGERNCGLKGGACEQVFQHGRILSTSSFNLAVAVVKPDILDYFVANGGGAGSLGIPTHDAVAMAGGANGDGFNQPFAGGLVSSGPTGTFSLRTYIRTAHGALGGVAGSLGWPTADQTCGLAGGACSQPFQHGTIYASSKKSGAVSYQPILDYYTTKGGPTGALGFPNGNAVVMNGGANGGGYNQSFAGGLVSSSAAGTFSLVGPVRTEHALQGGVAGKLGWPTADVVCGTPAGTCSQTFQHGTIYTVGTKAATLIYQPIVDYYTTSGGPTGPLGVPTATAVKMTGGKNGAGYNQPFQKGLVTSGPAGTFSLIGAFRTEHAKLGGVASKIGWPTADRVCGLPNNGCKQTFQHGTITIDSKGTRVVYN